MKLILIAFSCGLIAPLTSAQTYEQVAPQELPAAPQPELSDTVPEPSESGDEQKLLPSLRGLVFINNADDVQAKGIAVDGIDLSAVPSLATEDFRAKLRSRVGQPLTMGGLREITRETIRALREQDRPVTDVVVPEQNIQSGTIQILVIEGRLGRVHAEGNQWFSDDRLIRSIKTAPGEVISGSGLLADLVWVNQNPFRRVDLVFAPGTEPGEADVILRTHDRRPWRFYAGYDNYGTPLTGEDRWMAGFNWGNVFGLDHQLNYQFTTSSDAEKMVAHSGSYVIPLRWRHTLTLLGSYGESHPDIDFFDLKGETWQVSARYQVPLRSWNRLDHSFTVGFDFKRSNNNLAFGGTQIFENATDVVQAIFAYSASRADRYGSTAATVTFALSPGGIGGRNHDADYEGARSDAEARYAYLRLMLDRTTKLPEDFRWVTRLQAQVASANLLGSEQLGFGGAYSLRGYDEREMNGDHGAILVNEIHTPPFAVLSHLGLPQINDQLTLLGFLDAGVAGVYDPLPGEDQRREMLSAGAGFRYQIATNVSMRFDYGWQLRGRGDSPSGRESKGHLSVSVSY